MSEQRIVAQAYIVKNNKLLMVQENTGKDVGKWNPPTAIIGYKNNIRENLIKKVKKETGYDIELSNLISIQNIERADHQAIIICFTAKVIDGKIEYDVERLRNVKWFSLTEVEEMNNQLRMPFIKENIKSIEISKLYPIEMLNDL